MERLELMGGLTPEEETFLVKAPWALGLRVRV